MGWPEKSEKQSEECGEEHVFCQNCSPNFSATFLCMFFRSVNGKRRRKRVSENVNTKIQHRATIQSRMPTRWSCKPNQFSYASSTNDLIKEFVLQLAALHPSSHQTNGVLPGVGQLRLKLANLGTAERPSEPLPSGYVPSRRFVAPELLVPGALDQLASSTGARTVNFDRTKPHTSKCQWDFVACLCAEVVLLLHLHLLHFQ